MVEEIRRGYHEQLDDLKGDVIKLSALATEAVAKGTDVLLNADLAGADQVIAEDARLDELTHSIEERCYQLLARQQPMASDLRTIVSILRTIHELSLIHI